MNSRMMLLFIILSLLSSSLSFKLIRRNERRFGLSLSMQEFKTSEEYVAALEKVATLPKGFSVGISKIKFEPFEVANKILPMTLTLILLDEPTDSFAAAFTSNKFPGGPVRVGKDRIKNSKQLQGVIINNKISNVCPGGLGDYGYSDSDSICAKVAESFKLQSKDSVFPSSTGIIGWRLPLKDMQAAIPDIPLQKESMMPAANGIMTTDRYPKLRSFKSPSGWTVVGVAKGAGMIGKRMVFVIASKVYITIISYLTSPEPNMATMLSYIVTDLDISRAELEATLKETVSKTYNCISVDGDQSTSDTVLVMSSKQVKGSSDDIKLFKEKLKDICLGLSEDIVRNGEGCQHVMKITINGVEDKVVARNVGKSIVNSNLVKCAIAGSDPNVGRIVGAIGSYLGTLSDQSLASEMANGMSLKMGGYEIFSNGKFQLDPKTEKLLSDYMLDCQQYPDDFPNHERKFPPHQKCVEIEINFQSEKSTESVLVIGGDLTKEYVEVNADYRS